MTHIQLLSVTPVTNMAIESKPKIPDRTVRMLDAKQNRKRMIAPNSVSTIANGITIIFPIIFIIKAPFMVGLQSLFLPIFYQIPKGTTMLSRRQKSIEESLIRGFRLAI